MTDPGIMETFLKWAWAGVLGLVGVLWTIQRKEQENNRDNAKSLFEAIKEHTAHDEAMFREVTKQLTDGMSILKDEMHNNHIEVIKSMPKRKGDLE